MCSWPVVAMRRKTQRHEPEATENLIAGPAGAQWGMWRLKNLRRHRVQNANLQRPRLSSRRRGNDLTGVRSAITSGPSREWTPKTLRCDPKLTQYLRFAILQLTIDLGHCLRASSQRRVVSAWSASSVGQSVCNRAKRAARSSASDIRKHTIPGRRND
jgi:hypothetical protein